MNLQIDREFALRIKNIALSEVKGAIVQGWCHAGFAVDYAVRLVENGNSESSILELASIDYDSRFDILERLSLYESAESKDIDKNKWAKIMLAFGFEHLSELKEPLQFIEEIYADFDYPEEIAYLVRYMPYEGPRRDLMQDWKDFVETRVYDDIVLRPQNP